MDAQKSQIAASEHQKAYGQACKSLTASICISMLQSCTCPPARGACARCSAILQCNATRNAAAA
eukprot:scaffold303600_cov26-Tisochrysis_lutea.AAC.2